MTPGSLPRAISSATRAVRPSGDGAVGERGQGAGDLGEAPGAAEVGERYEERGAGAGDAQAVGEIGGAVGGHLGEDPGEGGLRRHVEGRAQPLRLAPDEAGEEGRAARRALEERAGGRGEVGEAGGDVGDLGLVVRTRGAGDAVGQRRGHQRPS